MSASELDDLLGELSSLSDKTSLQQALQALRPQRPPGLADAIKQCALVRWFDKQLYESICRDLKDKPTFEDFIGNAEVRRLRADRWSIEDSERERLLAEWQTDPSKWKRRNTDIGYHFAARDEP